VNRTSVSRIAADSRPDGGGLKGNALSFGSNLIIGVSSTAPAYSLAAALGVIVGAVGLGAPAIMVIAFLPMLFVAVAYFHLNRANPDCGTTFAWATQALGPDAGWMGGWAIIATEILVMPGLAQIAGQYSLHLIGVAEPNVVAATMIGIGWVVIMTAICYLGIELSAIGQKLLLTAEIAILVIFAVVALAKVYSSAPPGTSHEVSLTWFNPLTFGGFDKFMQAMLVAVFIYWGWDTGLSVNEETQNPRTTPATAAIVSTLILVCLYVLLAVAAEAYAGAEQLANSSDIFNPLGADVLGVGLGKLLTLAVLTSTAASTMTAILQATRTATSMARAGAIPKKFGEIHPRYLTPAFATLVVGAVSVIWYVLLTFISSDAVLQDSVTATAIGIAFYYGLTCFACVVLGRSLTRSMKNLALSGVVPALGGLIMFALLFGACFAFGTVDPNRTSLLGVGTPLVFAAGSFLLGLILLVLARLGYKDFFRRPRAIADGGNVRA
jgi:amino acid transporter